MVSLIDSDRLPTRALRDSETYLKRRVFGVENAAVLALLTLYRDAYRDIAPILSESLTRTEAERRIAERLARLRRDILLLISGAMTAALTGGYFGKLWQMDVATRPEVTINMLRTLPRTDDASASARELASIEMDALGVDVRRVLVAGGVSAAASVLMRRLRQTMGADSTRVTPHGNFNRVQVLTRTGVQDAANTGALTAMRQNGGVVEAYEWLTARDERVCPICAPRDGKRYTLDTWERPPIHPQCRCSLVPVLKDGAGVDPTEPMRQAFPQWLLTIGIQRELTDFLEPRG